MSLSDLASVTISAATSAPTRPGFGRPLIMGSALPALFQGSTQLFAELDEMVSMGFAVTHPVYKAASVMLGGANRVKDWKVGRRTTAPVQSVTLTVTAPPLVGTKYVVTVNATTATYTSGVADTATVVATALATALDADPAAGATAAAGVVTIVRNPLGGLNDVTNWTNNIAVKDNTPDPGIAADLAAVKAADNDWYGLVLDSNSKAEILSAAAWAEANKKIFSCNTSDTEVTDQAITNDVASSMKTLQYARTHLLYCGKQLLSFSGAAMMGNVFPFDPGSITWKFKKLPGVPADDDKSLTSGQSTNARNKNCNVYSLIAGIGCTEEGKSPSGEFVDIPHFLDWLSSEIQIRVYSLFINSKKIGFTDLGIEQIKNEVRGALSSGFEVGGLATAPAPGDVTAPAATATVTIDRAARKLTPVKFKGRLAGAIHTVEFKGTLSV